MKSILVALVGLISVVYLVNPTAGFFELIPDNIPFVGNLDEAGAMALLISSLRYFGFDIANLFKKDNNTSKEETPKKLGK
jgi:uncharacterized membrane protein YkvA (DUF1232 family)